MIPLKVHLNGDGCWPDLDNKFSEATTDVEVALLDGGVTSSKPSVTIRFNMPDGRVLLGQTTARLFCTAARMFMAKYPDLFDD